MRKRIQVALLVIGVIAAFGFFYGCARPRMPMRLHTPTWIQGTWNSEIGGQPIIFTEDDLEFQSGDRTYRASDAFSSVTDNATVVDYYTITGVPAFPLSLIRSGTVTLTFHRIDANTIEVQNPLGPSGRFIRQGPAPASFSVGAAEVRILW